MENSLSILAYSLPKLPVVGKEELFVTLRYRLE